MLPDLPGQQPEYGLKDLIRVTFLLNQKAPDGSPIQVNLLVSASLHSDSKLCALLSALGVTPGLEFDTEQLIGRTSRLETRQRTANGRTFSNIVATKPLRRRDQPVAILLTFKRAEARGQKVNGKPVVAQLEEPTEGEEL